MRIAWLSPLPPTPSGIADYSAEMVPLVAEAPGVEVDVYGTDHDERLPGFRVRRIDEYAERAAGYDAALFHLGNNPYHAGIYLLARERPGIAVFHDVVLHHLLDHFATLPEAPLMYDGPMEEEYGERGRRLASLRRNGVRGSGFELFVFPLVGHLARRAEGIVVHSEDSRDRIEPLAKGVPVQVVPHHAGAAPPAVKGVDRAEARRRLSLPPGAFVVGHFGFLTAPKQPAAVVEGFAGLHAERPDALLAFVGDDRTHGELDRLVDAHGVRPAVRTAGYVDMDRFYLYLRAVDAIVNLRYPSAGETSGTFARSLAEGRVVIANDYASFGEVPDDVALKVQVDQPQGPQVTAHLRRLASDPGFLRATEERARAYAARTLDPIRCRDLYVDFARSVATSRAGRAAGAPGT